MANDVWNPDQYARFKDERARPFFDLLALVERRDAMRVIDLGCGTGELTAELHRELAARETVGVDNSPAMLAKAEPHAGNGLRFERGEIEDYPLADASFDLVFSNAAVHWVDDHEQLFARMTRAIAPGGQLAVQMPANHHHASHTVAAEVAREAPFSAALGGYVRRSPVMTPEYYATLLHRLGFVSQRVRLEVYGHILPSRDGVVEWVRGTTLTDYEKRLQPALYAEFLTRYREKLFLLLADERPYFFAFHRIHIWGQLPGVASAV